LNATNPSSVIGNDCAGKTFTVTLRSDFTALKIYTFTISRSGDVGSYTYAITNPSVDVGSDPTIATDGRLVTINTNLDVDSTSVTRITIESS
jgi:hypothetical protein